MTKAITVNDFRQLSANTSGYAAPELHLTSGNISISRNSNVDNFVFNFFATFGSISGLQITVFKL